MKVLTFLLLVFPGFNIVAQQPLFVRVFDLHGKKIVKGNVLSSTDSTLLLRGQSPHFKIPARDIGTIKTKRSGGSNMLRGSVAGLVTLAIVGAASAEPDASFLPMSVGESAAFGGAVGVPIGFAIGGLTILFKKSRRYEIDGDLAKWRQFQQMVVDHQAAIKVPQTQ